MHTAITDVWSPANVIEANFSTGFATLYLLVVAAAIFVCCLSIMAATIRLCFGMSRDNQLPISGLLSRVSPGLHTPVWTCIVVALLAAVPFIQFSGAPTIAIAATAMIYFSYFLGNIAILRARARGWPRTSAPFRLGGWGMVVNILGLLYGGAMLVNFAWPRAASNPTPNQTVIDGVQNLDFHIAFLNKIPILWTVFVFIVLVGTIYYLAVGRNKEFAPIVTPTGDDLPLSAARGGAGGQAG
jgi:amino acid transporter